MDEAVKRAIAKWPNVPAVYEWLSLDRRGRWLLRGESIDNPAVTAFIARNYEHDAHGQWYFQNGPQRVFVDLEYTPIVVRVADDSRLFTHTGRPVSVIDGAWIDESGRMLVATEHGPALVDDRDIELFWSAVSEDTSRLDEDQVIAAIEELQRGGSADLRIQYAGKTVALRPIVAAEVATRFGFIAHPRSTDPSPCP
jgi:hypothetical protein